MKRFSAASGRLEDTSVEAQDAKNSEGSSTHSFSAFSPGGSKQSSRRLKRLSRRARVKNAWRAKAAVRAAATSYSHLRASSSLPSPPAAPGATPPPGPGNRPARAPMRLRPTEAMACLPDVVSRRNSSISVVYSAHPSARDNRSVQEMATGSGMTGFLWFVSPMSKSCASKE